MRLSIKILVLLLAASFLAGCSDERRLSSVTAGQLIGEWRSSDGGAIVFSPNETFSVVNIPARYLSEVGNESGRRNLAG